MRQKDGKHMRIKRDKDYRGKNNYKMLIKIILLNYK